MFYCSLCKILNIISIFIFFLKEISDASLALLLSLPSLPNTISKNEIGCGLGENLIVKETIKLILKTRGKKAEELLAAHTDSSRLAMYHL